MSSNLPLMVAKTESDGPWKRKPVISEDNQNNVVLNEAKPTKDNNDLIIKESSFHSMDAPGSSKDHEMDVAEPDEPKQKRNIEYTKEDLDRLESEMHQVNELFFIKSNFPNNPFKFQLDDAHTVIYSLESVVSSSTEEIPDSFFDVTVRDIRVLMSHLKDHSKNIDNAPLMTSKLRELEDAKKTLIQLQYKETLIRIQFPNRFVLQTVLKPIDTISSVKEFLKRYIREDIQQFDLCELLEWGYKVLERIIILILISFSHHSAKNDLK